MNESFIDFMLSRWQLTFFLEPFVPICQIIALIASIHYYRKGEILFDLFIFYIVCSLILIITPTLIFFNSSINKQVRGIEIFNVIFSLIELLIFYTYFVKILEAKTIRVIMLSLIFVYLFFFISFFIKIFTTNIDIYKLTAISTYVTAIGLSVMIIPCLIYYIELFKRPPIKNLFASPSFFIVTGIFFYCVIIIPFFLISENLRLEHTQIFRIIFAFHYFTFATFFLMLTKAFSCKMPLTI